MKYSTGLKSKCLVSLAIASTLFSIKPAFANDWYLVVTGESGDRYFMDRASITNSGATLKATSFTVYAKEDKGTVGYTEESEFDCKGKKYRSLKSTYFGEDGSVKRYGVDDEWTIPKAGRIGEYMLKEVCKLSPQ